MKLRNHQFSTQPQIFEHYKHPWYEHNERLDKQELNRPNPPTQQAIEKAKFIDKTYHWDRDNSVRPRNKRSAR
jgi:hypothetical protein